MPPVLEFARPEIIEKVKMRTANCNASLTKFVLGAHPIIEHFIETLRIREIIGKVDSG